MSNVKVNRVFLPCWCATGSSFPACVQQGLLFLLVCKRSFLPCWCFTGCSFPAGYSQGLLPLLVLHKFPTLKFYHGNQTKQVVSEMKTFKNKMVAVVAIFDLEVILLLQCVLLKSPSSLGGEVKNWFSRWRLWWPFWISNRHDFSYFSSACKPIATL